MRACLKQTTRCVIVRADGRRYEATNRCDVGAGVEVCPRVTAGCASGEGYDLCGSVHAEALVAEIARLSSDVPGEAFLYGHDWMCGPCQHALAAVNVRTFHIMEGVSDPARVAEPRTSGLPVAGRDPGSGRPGAGSLTPSSSTPA